MAFNTQFQAQLALSPNTIELRNVRVNNLKSVDLNIPHGQWISICGVSGSGKSSLALDTLYAEGQRRYVESLSPNTRQFLPQLDKPDAGRIDGIPPAIAVRGSQHKPGPRTTVGTATETVIYLRLLFARTATAFCNQCDQPISSDDPQSVANWTKKIGDARFQIGFPVDLAPAAIRATLADFSLQGFTRAIIGNHTVELNDPGATSDQSEMRAWIIVDRLTGNSPQDRICESLETAFLFGQGQATLLLAEKPQKSNRASTPTNVDGRPWEVYDFHSDLRCGNCDSRIVASEPGLFNFASPLGACELCKGIGKIDEWDLNKIVPDAELSIRDGAIKVWRSSDQKEFQERLLRFADSASIPVDKPFSSLAETQRELVLHNQSDAEYTSVLAFLVAAFQKAKSKKNVESLNQFRSPVSCPNCAGNRLNREALAYRIRELNIAQISRMALSDCAAWFQETAIELIDATPELKPLVQQIQQRIGYLCEIGLGYLDLNRSLRTLSRGEIQRVALASSLSSTLVNMLYVLDEPSIGLHPHDVSKLVKAIGNLQQRGNTLVVVDHQEDIIQAADRIIEIGPEAGTRGGEIVFDGSSTELVQPGNSLTGDFIAGRRGIGTGHANRRTGKGRLKLVGAKGNNLKDLTVEFPLSCLCVVTGVSGSGKTSLVRQTLYPAVCQRKGINSESSLPFEHVFGESSIDDIVMVDQSPIGRSARSNPVTYVKAFDEIRKAFAETLDAKTHNLSASHFSFNIDGGRCDKCKGNGQLSVDMQFLADVYMTCDQCQGNRYREDVLAVKYRGQSIADALNMTAREAFTFFRGHPKVQTKLKSLMDVGLDYVRLGQPATKLSSGEAQRLKLALHLNSSKKRSLFILDEPTTGLHMADVIKLLDCLEALLAVGHSLIIVEHNLNLIKFADWIIDMGPGAGDNGGQIIAQGPPEVIASHPDSLTGKFLSPILSRAKDLDEANA